MHGYENVRCVYQAEYEGNTLRFTLVRNNTGDEVPAVFYLPKSAQAIHDKGLVPSRETRFGEPGLYYDEGKFTLSSGTSVRQPESAASAFAF